MFKKALAVLISISMTLSLAPVGPVYAENITITEDEDYDPPVEDTLSDDVVGETTGEASLEDDDLQQSDASGEDVVFSEIIEDSSNENTIDTTVESNDSSGFAEELLLDEMLGDLEEASSSDSNETSDFSVDTVEEESIEESDELLLAAAMDEQGLPTSGMVSSSSELKAALETGLEKIKIISDFQLDQTYYISSDVTIYSEEEHTISRSPDFAGNLFVIGETENESVSGFVTANFGVSLSGNNTLLTIDGNAEHMQVEVTGSAITVRSNGSVSLFKDMSFVNHEKKASSGDTTNGCGAVVYNAGNLQVSGGSFANNKAVNGGVIYNSGTVDINGSEFSNNSATEEGGVLYGASDASTVINSASFINNMTESSSEGNGGAISVHSHSTSITDSVFTGNHSAKSGGALYVSYASSSSVNSYVVISGSTLNNNGSAHQGGAVYVTADASKGNDTVLSVMNSTISSNTSAFNGGGIYITTGGAEFNNVDFTANTAEAAANDSGSRYGGGALYLSGCIATITGGSYTENESMYNAGAIALYSGSEVVIDGITASGNAAGNAGGAIYNSGSNLQVKNAVLSSNTSTTGGGAAALYSEALTSFEVTQFIDNKAATNGGALFIYTGATDTSVTGSSFSGNEATQYGGAIYISKASLLSLEDVTASNNKAVNGGVLYETTTSTLVTIKGLTVTQNTADSGNIIYGNTTKAILKIDKSKYVDTEEETLDDTYWASAIANKLTVIEIQDESGDDPGEEDPEEEVSDHVKSSGQLLKAINQGYETIIIDDDFDLDRTFYITGDLNIRTETDHTLRRAAGFAGDLFVVGEESEGNNSSSAPAFSLGNSDRTTGTLTIDGNASNMQTAVNGSLLFITNGAKVSLNNGIVIQNANKSGNIKTLSEKYDLGSSTHVGGSVAIVENGVLTINGGEYSNNTVASSYYGGVIYNAAEVRIKGGTFNSNSASRGGVISNASGKLSIRNAELNGNTAEDEGGAVYAAADCSMTIVNASFSENRTTSADDGGGGAISVHSNKVTINGTNFTNNTSQRAGGALYVSYASSSTSNSDVKITDSVFEGNTAVHFGGAVYATAKATEDLDNVLMIEASEFKNNSSVKGGGAVVAYSNAKTEIRSSEFDNNSTNGNGGALYVYTGAVDNIVSDTTFSNNSAVGYGGAIYISNASKLGLYSDKAIGNSAANGGYMYITSTATEVTMIGQVVSGNTATVSGPIIYGNTNKAILNINKSDYTDLDQDVLDDEYWAKAIANKLTVNDISDPIPESGTIKNPTDVSSSEDLEKALTDENEYIRVVSDFELDRTFYITNKTVIYSTRACTLKRAANFGGDLFVVGEDKTGRNAILDKKTASLTMGKPGSSVNDLLIIDGNKDGMASGVTGSVFFICYSGVVNLNNNLTVINCKKTGNNKSNNSKYHLPYPERIGGAMAIVANGTLNVYGGLYSGNEVNAEAETLTDDDLRTSTVGGAIFNYSNLNIYGGEFENNSAGRGGAIYNYRMTIVYKGVFDSNTASKYGGAVYQAESQFGELLLGRTAETNSHDVVFRNNSARNSGGALYSQTKNAIVIYGNTLFSGNRAVNYNGGAINVSGTLTIKRAEFENNYAYSKGGAIYIVNDDDTLTTRFIRTNNTVFTGNTANRGGAVGMMAAETTYSEGGIASFTDCSFIANHALDVSGSGSSSDMQGGAIYVIRKSQLTLTNCNFDSNIAVDEGGAIYGSSESVITLKDTSFNTNKAIASATGNGGAIAIHSCQMTSEGSTFSGNESARSAGALYISYVGSSEKDSVVTLSGDSFLNNDSKYHGGAIYTTTHIEDGEDLPLSAYNAHFTGNHASYNGGAMYFTGSKAYLENVELTQNSVDATANSSGSRYGGGALYLTGSAVEINKAVMAENNSAYNGGAIALYSSSSFVGNEINGNNNIASNFGGAIYSNKSVMNLYHSSFEGNSSEKGGGAVTLYTDAETNLYTTYFKDNQATGNGGAVYVYTGATDTMIRDCEFDHNSATSYGGAVYCSNGSTLSIFCNKDENNNAKNGGVLYITSTGTTVNLADFTVGGNTASDAGPIIYGNSAKAILNIDKTQYTDLDTEQLDTEYWSNAIAGKLTVNEVSITIPSYTDYDHSVITPEDPVQKDPVPVDDVFSLTEITEDSSINTIYDGFEKLDNTSNFMSEQETVFENINGNNVKVDTFVYQPGEPEGNPNYGEGILIYQAMLYKKAHPEKDVSISISSFRFSVEAAVCINRNSKYFGYMRNLGASEYDQNGFVRVAYLLITAAKMGIHVNVIGQMDAYPVSSKAQRFKEYFTSRQNDPCDPLYVENGVISDFLEFTFIDWTSYGDDGASDMMHTKVCAVSNYTDMNGVDHSGTIWSSSANLDGINSNGTNGNNNVQTGSIISDHNDLYRVTYNYLKMISEYGGQEDVYEFRDLIGKITTDQVKAILEGKEIDPDKQIVYLGSETDDTFELYFSPYGGSAADWDETYNPFCKYLRKLNESDDYILFSWSNVKFNKNFSLSTSMEDMIIQAFHNNRNVKNRIYILLPTFNSSAFNDLIVGKDIGYKSFGVAAHGSVHSKDVQLSYSENGVRKYVTILNSMNIHQGAMSYQSNFSLVIKEDECAEDSVFFTIADGTTAGIVDHNYGEEQRHEPEGTEEGYTYSVCQDCGDILVIGVIHNDNGDWIIDREATESSKGLKHRECIACGEILEAQEIEIIGQQAAARNKSEDIGLTISSEDAVMYNIPDIVENVPLTYEAEIYLPKNVTGRAGVIIGNYAGSDSNAVSFEVYSNGHPRIYFRNADQGKSYSYVFDYDVRTGKKIHVAIVLDGTEALLYINGILEETISITDTLPVLSTELNIGGDARNGNGQYFKGTIYAVNLFGDVRTPAEIKRDVSQVNAGADQLIFSKYFSDESCPKSTGGHVLSDWIVDYEPTDTENGISHRECINCGETLEIIETTLEGETTKTLNLSSSKGLNMRSSDIKYALPEIVENMPLTYEAEIYLPKSVSARGGVIIGNYAGPDVNSVSFEVKTYGRPRIYYRDAENQKSYSYTFSTDIRGRKVHIAIKLDGNKAILYVDGVKKEEKTVSESHPKLTSPLCIGGDARDGNEHYFKGTIYSINVFNDVRTDDEIKKDVKLVNSDSEGLVYSKYFTGNICPAGKDETVLHSVGEWIVDEEPTETTKGSKHRECVVCGEVLEVCEIPAEEYAGNHVSYNGAAGLNISSAEDLYPIENEKLNSAPKTIEATILLPKSYPSSSRAGVVVGNYSGKNLEMSFEIYTNGHPRLYIRNGSEYSYIFSSDIRSDSKRYIAITVGEGEANLYVDGKLEETIEIATEMPVSNSVTYVGGDGRSGNGQYFKGKVYSAHIFSDIRTADEIALDKVYVSDTEEDLMYGDYF